MRRNRIVVVVALLMFLATGCDWSQWGANAMHTSVTGATNLSPSTTPQLTPDVLTTATATGQVVTGGGDAFVVSDGTLTAYDATSRALVWSAALPSGTTIGSVPAVDLDATSNTVFVMLGGAQPVLIGYDVAGARNCSGGTCNPIFIASLGNGPAAASPPVVSNGHVYANGAAAVYAFDGSGTNGCVTLWAAQACAPLWSQAIGGAAPGVGPAVANNVLYDAAVNSSGFGLAAFDPGSGTPLWFGPLRDAAITATPSVTASGSVVVPTAHALVVFAGTCATSSCEATTILSPGTNEMFAATATVTDSAILAAATDGTLYSWPVAGCGSSICLPAASAAVDAPAGGATDYAQTAVVENGAVFVIGRQTTGSGDHVAIEAFGTSLTPLETWDLGAGGLAPGLTSASIANGVVYAPTSGSVFVLTLRTTPIIGISPLALTPAFAPDTTDYVLRCAAGTNTVNVAAAAAGGGTIQLVAPVATAPTPAIEAQVALVEDAALVVVATSATGTVTQYWIRCLPHDFPMVTVHPHPAAGTPSPGWYLTGTLALGGATYGDYAMILDPNGVPVWYKRTTPAGAIDVTSLAPNTVTFATAPAGQGFGTDPNGGFTQHDLANGTTSRIAAVTTPTDFHELLALPNGDRMVLTYVPMPGVDLTGLPGNPAPGPNSTILDCRIQELDPQGNLVWSWAASDHIDPVTESMQPSVSTAGGQTAYDVFHCNSVDVDGAGNVLLSARNTNAIFDIDRASGSVVWKLGGTATNKDGARIIRLTGYPYANFGGQHDARFLPNGGIGLFDDQSFGAGPAAGVELQLDLTAGTAQPTFVFTAPNGKNSVATGTFRVEPDGDRLIGWGLTSTFDGSLFTEVGPTGNDVLDASLPAGTGAYRVLKFPVGQFDIGVLRATAGGAP